MRESGDTNPMHGEGHVAGSKTLAPSSLCPIWLAIVLGLRVLASGRERNRGKPNGGGFRWQWR